MWLIGQLLLENNRRRERNDIKLKMQEALQRKNGNRNYNLDKSVHKPKRRKMNMRSFLQKKEVLKETKETQESDFEDKKYFE
jgi:hypothetical protein